MRILNWEIDWLSLPRNYRLNVAGLLSDGTNGKGMWKMEMEEECQLGDWSNDNDEGKVGVGVGLRLGRGRSHWIQHSTATTTRLVTVLISIRNAYISKNCPGTGKLPVLLTEIIRNNIWAVQR